MTRCGPDDGVRWRTFADDDNRPERVLDGDQQRVWSVGELLDQPRLEVRPGRPRDADSGMDEGADIGGDERLLLHIPESALR